MFGGIGGIMVTGNATATRSAGVAATRKGGGYGGGGKDDDDDNKDTDKWGCLYMVVGFALLVLILFIFFLYSHSPTMNHG
jgi:hypothetical protein